MEKTEKNINKKNVIKYVLAFVVPILAVTSFIYWNINHNRIFIEKADISAASIDLSANTPGILEEVTVNEGDAVKENSIVARVGDEMIKAPSSGIVIKTKKDIGKNVNKGEAIVTMINPEELRVIAHLEEDKGLKDVKVGQRAMFKVDAFGSKKFFGIVDEISETSRDSDIVFSISDKREMKKFDVKIKFNVAAYSELKNGMSAQAWIYKN